MFDNFFENFWKTPSFLNVKFLLNNTKIPKIIAKLPAMYFNSVKFKKIPNAEDKTPSVLKTIEKPTIKLNDTKNPSNLELDIPKVYAKTKGRTVTMQGPSAVEIPAKKIKKRSITSQI